MLLELSEIRIETGDEYRMCDTHYGFLFIYCVVSHNLGSVSLICTIQLQNSNKLKKLAQVLVRVQIRFSSVNVRMWESNTRHSFAVSGDGCAPVSR
jgi:hypothetical protein